MALFRDTILFSGEKWNCEKKRKNKAISSPPPLLVVFTGGKFEPENWEFNLFGVPADGKHEERNQPLRRGAPFRRK
jgi:hypothetical protein